MHFLLTLLALVCSPVANANVVDRIVIVVQDELVMESDIRLETVLAGLDPSPSPFWHRERSTPTQRLMDAAVFRELAGQISLYQPAAENIEERLDTIRHRFGTRQSWQAFLNFWGLDEPGFFRILRRRMIVELYLKRNLQTEAQNIEEWSHDCESLLKQVRPRYRIRVVPPTSP